MKDTTRFNFIMLGLGVLCIAASWFLVTLISDYLRDKHTVTETDFDFSLKADPEEVIYSQAYVNEQGQNNIKYAYLGREVLSIEGEDLARRTPSSQTVVIERYEDEEGKSMEKLKTIFTASPQYFKDETGWRQIEYATTTQEVFSQSGAVKHIKRRELAEQILHKLFGIKPVFAAVSTFYPNPDTETTSVDGQVDSFSGTQVPPSSIAWSASRDAADGTTFNDSATTAQVQTILSYIVRIDKYVTTINRAFFLFDTSALGGGATISSATLSLYVTTKNNGDNDGSDTVNIVTTTPASNTSLALADVDQAGTTLQASAIDITSISTSAYSNFSLNATGLGNISKTGITKFGAREGHDLGNNEASVDTTTGVTISTAEETGTSQDPKLEVTYTVATFSMGQWFPF